MKFKILFCLLLISFASCKPRYRVKSIPSGIIYVVELNAGLESGDTTCYETYERDLNTGRYSYIPRPVVILNKIEK